MKTEMEMNNLLKVNENDDNKISARQYDPKYESMQIENGILSFQDQILTP